MHPFRFGVVAANARTGDEWAQNAQRIEALGFDVLGIPDGLNYTLAPLPALAAAAAVTSRLRLGTYVIANDFRNPVLLAKEAASLDWLSNGRFELGIGAGRPGAEADNRGLGIPFDSGAVRLARLSEAIPLIKTLLCGEKATVAGQHYQVAGSAVSPRGVQQPRPPVLIAAAGNQMLRLAAREADIVALGVPPTATEADVADRIRVLRDAAANRFDELELNLNLMAVGDSVPRYLAGQLGLTAESLAAAGSAAAIVGSTDAMCQTLRERRERLGISYIMVGDELMESLAPVVERLRGE
jgi:probable F420-dependent oxidoreductase